MKDLIFKGLSKSSGNWISGYLSKDLFGSSYLWNDKMEKEEVLTESVAICAESNKG